MVKWKDKLLHLKQERRIVDSGKWWNQELHNEFLKKIEKEFTPEERKKFMESWFVEIKYLEHIPQHIINAFKARKQNTLESETKTIEVIIDDQLIGLLYDRRTDLNNSEVTYIIFKEKLQKLKNKILKNTKK